MTKEELLKAMEEIAEHLNKVKELGDKINDNFNKEFLDNRSLNIKILDINIDLMRTTRKRKAKDDFFVQCCHLSKDFSKELVINQRKCKDYPFEATIEVGGVRFVEVLTQLQADCLSEVQKNA